MPFTIKDTGRCKLKNMKLVKGSKIVCEDPNIAVQSETSDIVTTLLNQGAIMIGMTTVPELCAKGTTSSHLYGITRNPFNLDLTPGGSSGTQKHIKHYILFVLERWSVFCVYFVSFVFCLL